MIQYYLIHYFNFKNAGGFMLVSLFCLIAVLAIVLIAAKVKKHYKLGTQDLTPKQIRKLNHIHRIKEISLIESFYEMVFSSTSVLLFVCLYYIIDERIPQAALYWQKYQNIILLLFLVFSVFMTTWFDILFVPLGSLSSQQKASIRLVSSFYIILILLYIKFIYDDSNYDSLIMYFITLAVGRFLYFVLLMKIQIYLAGRCQRSSSASADGHLFCHCLLVRIPLWIPADFEWCDS